jgi:hypothetical protein
MVSYEKMRFSDINDYRCNTHSHHRHFLFIPKFAVISFLLFKGCFHVSQILLQGDQSCSFPHAYALLFFKDCRASEGGVLEEQDTVSNCAL